MKQLLLFLVGWLPGRFRSDFGSDVEEHIECGYDAAARRGFAAALAFTVRTLGDLVWVALSERMSPTRTRRPGTAPRRTGGDGMTSAWVRDLYFAARSLGRSPGFVVTAVGTLGLSIGLCAAIFAVVQKVLIEPLPFPDADRLVFIGASAPGSDFSGEFPVSLEFYFEYAEQTDIFDAVGTYTAFTNTLRVGDRVERVRMSVPTASTFQALGAEPLLGRLPRPEDGEGVVLLSYDAWRDWYGADPEVLGRAQEITDLPRTIIGVMGPEFTFPQTGTMVWFPNPITNEGITPGRFGVNLVARLAPGVEIETARDRMRTVARRLPELYGGSPRYARLIEQHEPVIRPLQDELAGHVRAPLRILMGAVLMVLLIACANVTNLFFVRAERRQRDLAVRRAIGAGWGQLVRLQLAESVLVAFAAGALAVALARVGLPLLVAAAPETVPRLGEVAMSLPALVFTVVASIAVALLCGLPPAFRGAGVRTGTLREGTRGSTRRVHRSRNALVALQTALALLLLVGSGLLWRSFTELRGVDPGYDTEDIFTFQMAIEDEPGIEDAVSAARFHLDFMERLRGLQGVESVGLVENLPLNEGVGSVPLQTEETRGDDEAGVQVGRTWAAGDYFRTMGISILRGRDFDEAEQLENPGSVILSQRAADRLWPGEDPLGRSVYWPSLDISSTVVGVVEDVAQSSFREEAEPLAYFPLVAPDPTIWTFTSPAFVIRTERAETIGAEVRALVREMAPSAPMYRVFTMEGLASDSMIGLSFTLVALGIASVMALLLGSVGLYGILSSVVAERTREIGVRMALGAGATGVRRMVVLQGVRVVAVGVVVGLVVAALSVRSLQSLLFGVQALDPVTFGLVAAAMLLVGAMASYLPARRASSVDPVESLRAG